MFHFRQGVSSLSELLAEMVQVFQRDTPLYTRCPVQAPPPPNVHLSAVKAPPTANVQFSSVQAPSTAGMLLLQVCVSICPSSALTLSAAEAPPPLQVFACLLLKLQSLLAYICQLSKLHPLQVCTCLLLKPRPLQGSICLQVRLCPLFPGQLFFVSFLYRAR